MQPFPSFEGLHDETTGAAKTVVARQLTASGQERSAYVSDLLRRDAQHVPDRNQSFAMNVNGQLKEVCAAL